MLNNFRYKILKKSRNYVSIFLFCLVYVLTQTSLNALQITEIHFDPPGSDTDREWIEVFNDTQNAVDLSQIKFFEANVNHGIDIFNLDGSTEKNILAGEYVVIVQDFDKFKTDFPGYTGKIFKASFSLSNTGETMALKDVNGNVLHTVTYTNADKQETPTPGAVNLPNVNQNNSNNNSTSTATTTNPVSSSTSTATTTTTQNLNNDSSPNYYYKSYWPDTEKIYVKAGENRIVMQGQEVVFSPKVLDGNKKQINSTGGSVQYRWNFGDGYTSEKREGLHSYKFVGEFVVNLQVNSNGYVDEDKLYVKVVEPKLSVKVVEKENYSQGGVEKFDVVEIKNENNFELDVGNLEIKNELGKTFLIPQKTLLMAGRSVFFGPEITGFSSSTPKVVLNLLNGKVISEFVVETIVSSSAVLVSTTTQRLTPKISNNKSEISLTTKPVAKKQSISLKKENQEKLAKQSTSTNKIEFSNNFQNKPIVPSSSFLANIRKIWGI